MSTLHDRLSQLADDAPQGSPPGDLWSNGRRLHRRRQTGTVVIVTAALALLLGLGSLSVWKTHVDVQPADATTDLGLPDQIYAADPHLPGTDDTGPIGPLVAVVPTVREAWLGDSSNGLLGISATGEYAFLDLPRLTLEPLASLPAVSADGRYVGYWAAGRPSGTPGSLREDPVTGVAAYDTVTGEVYEYDVATEHGLEPETLLWAEGRLWFDVWQLDAPLKNGSSASRTQVVAWDPAADEEHVWDDDPPELSRASAWRDSVVGIERRGDVRRSTPGRDRESFGRVTKAPDLRSALFVSEDGSRAVGQAALDGPTDGRGPILVGRLGVAANDKVRLARVPNTADIPVDVLLGWRDARSVVALEYSAGTGEARLVAIDIAGGKWKTLGYAEGNQPVIAADALTGPVFDGPKPPRPIDPRLLYGGGLAIVLAAGLALLWWRRRVQR